MLKYPGSKWRLAKWIINHFPAHTTYLEPFFGSGAVFFTKPPSKVETINDLDGQVINLFRVIRERPRELAALIEMTPWARGEYTSILVPSDHESSFLQVGEPLEDARRFLVRMWMAMGAKSSDRSGWCNNIQNLIGSSKPKTWQGLPARIIATSRRLKDAQIESQPAIKLIVRYGYPEVLIYADPPYMFETRRERRQYKNEMTDADHIELLEVLDTHPGPVVLSGYACPLYDERLKHWIRREAKAQAEKGNIRTEVLWINPVAAKSLQVRLFDEVIQ